jgi:hypothetical protein
MTKKPGDEQPDKRESLSMKRGDIADLEPTDDDSDNMRGGPAGSFTRHQDGV